MAVETPFSPLSFEKFHENPFSCSREWLSHIYALSWRTEKRNICKTYTHPRPLAAADAKIIP